MINRNIGFLPKNKVLREAREKFFRVPEARGGWGLGLERRAGPEGGEAWGLSDFGHIQFAPCNFKVLLA